MFFLTGNKSIEWSEYASETELYANGDHDTDSTKLGFHAKKHLQQGSSNLLDGRLDQCPVIKT